MKYDSLRQVFLFSNYASFSCGFAYWNWICVCLLRWQEWEMLWHTQLINSFKTMDLFGFQAQLLLPQIVKELGSSFTWLLWLVFLQYVSLDKLLTLLEFDCCIENVLFIYVKLNLCSFLCLPKYFNWSLCSESETIQPDKLPNPAVSLLEWTCCNFFFTYIAYRTSLKLCLSNIWCMEVIEMSSSGLLLDQVACIIWRIVIVIIEVIP